MVKTSFGDASGEGVISLGQQAWNIADGYTKIKILRLLIELDLYETIAMYGRKDLDEQISNEDKSYKRVEALHRIIFSLKQLIGNCKFAIRNKKDVDLLNVFLERIENVEAVFEAGYNEVENAITKETQLNINEEHFRKCFDILRSVKDDFNIPINKANLIFRQSDDVDLDKVMNEIIEGG